jgi:hypothetical protein
MASLSSSFQAYATRCQTVSEVFHSNRVSSFLPLRVKSFQVLVPTGKFQ